ncbi:MAG TPA: FeoA family protein [Bacillota bacterium]|nr:FeoA family protein [Bacillota bacterium]
MKGRPAEKMLLAAMKPGQLGEVISFLHPETPAIQRLAALGFLPGEKFKLERCRPDYLIRFGYTRLAINRRLAREVLVYMMKVSSASGREVL